MDIRLKFFWIQFSIFESKKIKQFNNFSAIVLLVLSIQFLEGERPPSLYTAKDPKPKGLGSKPLAQTKLKRLPSLDTANNHTIAWEKSKIVFDFVDSKIQKSNPKLKFLIFENKI